jgi:hypothetical protein
MYDISPGVAPDRRRPFYVTNLVVPSLAHTYEKDTLQCQSGVRAVFLLMQREREKQKRVIHCDPALST